MTAIHFTLRVDLRQRLDLSPLRPDQLSDAAPERIAAIALQYGNRRLPVTHFFELDFAKDGEGLHFTRGDERFDGLGRGMTSGRIRVAGDAGAYVGLQMAGGGIIVEGNAGIFCGAEMSGGELCVNGHAGDLIGGALPGNRKGMSGGFIRVRGHAGDRVGDHMRRGVIVIEGDAGAYTASRMTAGTIAVRGGLGPYPGYGMRRGTLLLAKALDAVPPTFNDCGVHTLGFLPLLLRSSPFRGTSFAQLPDGTARVRRYAGDQSRLGKGEILILQAPAA